MNKPGPIRAHEERIAELENRVELLEDTHRFTKFAWARYKHAVKHYGPGDLRAGQAWDDLNKLLGKT